VSNDISLWPIIYSLNLLHSNRTKEPLIIVREYSNQNCLQVTYYIVMGHSTIYTPLRLELFAGLLINNTISICLDDHCLTAATIAVNDTALSHVSAKQVGEITPHL